MKKKINEEVIHEPFTRLHMMISALCAKGEYKKETENELHREMGKCENAIFKILFAGEVLK